MEKKIKLFAVALAVSLIFPLTAGAQLRFMKYATRAVATGIRYHRYAENHRHQIYREIHRRCPVVRPTFLRPRVDVTHLTHIVASRPAVRLATFTYNKPPKAHPRRIYRRNRHHRRSRT